LVLLNSCTEEVESPVLQALEAPELMAPDGSLEYVLTEENAENPFETFIYTNAKFTEPIITNYTVEIADVADDEFSNKLDMQESTTQLFQTIDVKTFNLLFGAAGLDKTPGERATVNVRVRADNANADVDVMYSNVIQLNVTPYDAVIPPIYILGSGTEADWSPGDAIPLPSISADEYSAIVQINSTHINGSGDEGTFRFKDNNIDWGGENWHYSHMTSIETDPADIEVKASSDGDDNFTISQSGKYEILFNKKNKTVKFTLQAE